MKTWTIKSRIITGFTIIVALTSLLGMLAWNSVRIMGEHANDLAAEDVPAMANSADLLQNLAETQLTFLNALLATNAEARRAYAAKLKELDETNAISCVETEKLASSAEEKQALERFKKAQLAYLAARASIQKLNDLAKNDEAMAQFQLNGRSTYDAYNSACMELNDLETKVCTDGAATVQHQAQYSRAILIATVLVEVVISILLSSLIVTGLGSVLKAVSSSLNDGSSQVVSAASQVSASSQTLAEGASEQASSLEETSSSLEEMAAMTKRNAGNARQANELAKQAREAADKGVMDMQTMGAAMEAIRISSDDIAKIIKTIDEIAFQTNILALNAAVEAARAGEAGMGFAVVADEVRNLAQRCAQAAKETAAKIEGAITKTGQGVDISVKVAAALNVIVTKVRQVDELVTEVAGASREQTDGIAQINVAVGQMDKVTQGNAANAEECAAAAEELSSQAEVMKQSVAELLALVGGQGESPARKPAVYAASAKAFPSPVAKPPALRSSNGNGHVLATATDPTATKRRSDIPLEGEFKDF